MQGVDAIPQMYPPGCGVSFARSSEAMTTAPMPFTGMSLSKMHIGYAISREFM